jgi:hypothetical protein
MKQSNETDDSMRDYHVSFSYYAHRNKRLIVSFLLYVLSHISHNYERLIKGANLEQNYDEQLEEFRIQNGS